MTRRVGGLVIIEDEPPGICEMCGKLEELRPYGPKGERICYECMQKDPAAADRQIRKLFGERDN